MVKIDEYGFLNAKRIKIIIGIIAILVFGLVYDFLAPINGSKIDNNELLRRYTEDLYSLADNIESFYGKYQTLPTNVLGGDKAGYLSVGDKIPDQLIDSGLIDSYASVYPLYPISQRRALVEFRMKNPMYNVLFGKNGDRQVNIVAIDPNILVELFSEKDSEFPFHSCFFYSELGGNDAYQIFIILPEQFKRDEFLKYRNVLDIREYPYGWYSFPVKVSQERPIIGLVGKYEYGEWRRYEFFTGGTK